MAPRLRRGWSFRSDNNKSSKFPADLQSQKGAGACECRVCSDPGLLSGMPGKTARTRLHTLTPAGRFNASRHETIFNMEPRALAKAEWPVLSPNWTPSIQKNQRRKPLTTGITGSRGVTASELRTAAERTRCSAGPAYPLLLFPLGVPHYATQATGPLTITGATVSHWICPPSLDELTKGRAYRLAGTAF